MTIFQKWPSFSSTHPKAGGGGWIRLERDEILETIMKGSQEYALRWRRAYWIKALLLSILTRVIGRKLESYLIEDALRINLEYTRTLASYLKKNRKKNEIDIILLANDHVIGKVEYVAEQLAHHVRAS
ncbi:MAG: hypothetical protein COU06_00630 [Candidatus Harrisonbacteria bacterium CG10_big_fil_rev_8_21_14_0_10_38_8]|uniref:Uncharacterized protein n=1 Tax=Candidatus Harrisonbacteria bacterium CG10_big_fil_rev_8_21_14_0_10_38_8 TaxID=1974582 RepID=A0A2M6WKH7_9BACT|nr:MAG: hypothetical protein COU06_00630 [Candidatus Harrisonbacteria bacterium CG10_big_fil_rev_8_21_14_0_10_38_8]